MMEMFYLVEKSGRKAPLNFLCRASFKSCGYRQTAHLRRDVYRMEGKRLSVAVTDEFHTFDLMEISFKGPCRKIGFDLEFQGQNSFSSRVLLYSVRHEGTNILLLKINFLN